MLEYEFERIAVSKGVFVGKSTDHQDAIRSWAEAGWRYAGWVPATQSNGFITTIDLIFEREQAEE